VDSVSISPYEKNIKAIIPGTKAEFQNTKTRAAGAMCSSKDRKDIKNGEGASLWLIEFIV